jgi:hypothetical protein
LFGLEKNMSKKIVWIVVVIVLLIGAFYGGMIYGKGQTSTSVAGGSSAYSGARGMRGAGGFGGGAAAGGSAFGQIISKDATSITVQLATPTAGSTSQSGSKIILLDQGTKISKQSNGTLSDLAVGTNVSVAGTANTDGSISAQSIQIRPAGTGAPQRAPMIPAQ